MRKIIVFLLVLNSLLTLAQVKTDYVILINEHKSKAPLQSAFKHSIRAIETRVELDKTGKLVCGKYSLEDDFMQPLKKRIDENGNFVFKGKSDEFLLILQCKGDSAQITKALYNLVDKHKEYLTSFENGKKNKKGIRLIVHGDVNETSLSSQNKKYIQVQENSIKAKLELSSDCYSIFHIDFGKQFNWNGKGAMPNMTYHSVTSYIKNAHKNGRWVRISQPPGDMNSFSTFWNAGVDFIDIEDADVFADWLKKQN